MAPTIAVHYVTISKSSIDLPNFHHLKFEQFKSHVATNEATNHPHVNAHSESSVVDASTQLPRIFFSQLSLVKTGDVFEGSLSSDFSSSHDLRKCASDCTGRTFVTQVLPEFLRRCTSLAETLPEDRHYLVLGTHGLGTRIVIDETDDGDDVAITVAELVSSALVALRYDAVVLDCCLMATVECTSSLATVTPVVGASQGYMWEEDDDVDRHIFTCDALKAMQTMHSMPVEVVLSEIGRLYTAASPRGDFSVLRTAPCAVIASRLDSLCDAATTVDVQVIDDMEDGIDALIDLRGCLCSLTPRTECRDLVAAIAALVSQALFVWYPCQEIATRGYYKTPLNGISFAWKHEFY